MSDPTRRIAVINTSCSDPRIHDDDVVGRNEYMREAGFVVDLLPEKVDYKQRGSLINKVLQDGEYDFVWSLCGGIELIYVLPYLDLDSYKKTSTVIGESDITHLSFPLAVRGHQVLFGPSYSSFLKQPKTIQESLLNLLRHSKDNSHLSIIPINGKQPVTRNLIGGTSRILTNLIGLSGIENVDQQNWFIEDHYKKDVEYRPDLEYWLTIQKQRLEKHRAQSLIVGGVSYTSGDGLASRAEQLDLVEHVFRDASFPVGLMEMNNKRTFVWLGDI